MEAGTKWQNRASVEGCEACGEIHHRGRICPKRVQILSAHRLFRNVRGSEITVFGLDGLGLHLPPLADYLSCCTGNPPVGGYFWRGSKMSTSTPGHQKAGERRTLWLYWDRIADFHPEEHGAHPHTQRGDTIGDVPDGLRGVPLGTRRYSHGTASTPILWQATAFGTGLPKKHARFPALYAGRWDATGRKWVFGNEQLKQSRCGETWNHWVVLGWFSKNRPERSGITAFQGYSVGVE